MRAWGFHLVMAISISIATILFTTLSTCPAHALRIQQHQHEHQNQKEGQAQALNASSFVHDFLSRANRAGSISQHQLTPRIVGGQPASNGQFPYFATVIISATSLCGGTFIAPNYVLTAAHCLDPTNEVVLGHGFSLVYYDSTELEEGKYATILNFELHPNYSPATFTNDFAILELKTSVSAPSVTLDDGSSGSHVGDMATTCGFGRTQYEGSRSRDLLYVDLLVLPDSDCENVSSSPMSSSQLCAGGINGKDSCQGDSGGPLLKGSSSVQIGVVSSGKGCADPVYPGALYSRVSEAYGWITRTLEDGLSGSALRCENCTRSSECQGALSCYAGVCEWQFEDEGICDTPCCSRCGCSTGSNCLNTRNEPCQSHCDCLDPYVCTSGRCLKLGEQASVSSLDCFASDAVALAPHGEIMVENLKRGDLVFDGHGFTKVIINVDMHKATSSMMFVHGRPTATVSHSLHSGLTDANDYVVKPHGRIFFLYTESRYIQVSGVRISSYVSTYPTWLQEIGIKAIEKSSLARKLVELYRPRECWEKAMGAARWVFSVFLMASS